jgi:hypothetical protein
VLDDDVACGAELSAYRLFNAAFASVEKGAIDPIVQSVAMARKY